MVHNLCTVDMCSCLATGEQLAAHNTCSSVSSSLRYMLMSLSASRSPSCSCASASASQTMNSMLLTFLHRHERAQLCCNEGAGGCTDVAGHVSKLRWTSTAAVAGASASSQVLGSGTKVRAETDRTTHNRPEAVPKCRAW